MRLGIVGALTGILLSVAAAGPGTARPAVLAGPTVTAPPTVTGTARQGGRLTASAGSWTGSGTIAYAYQWYRCDGTGAKCSSIHGATAKTYTLVPADAGRTIGLSVKAVDPTGTATAHASIVGPVALPDSTLYSLSQPKATGKPEKGQELRVDTGTWAGVPTSFAYRWQRCNENGRVCTPIAGATKAAYAVTQADTGHALLAVVEAVAGPVRQGAFSTAVGVGAGAGLPSGATPLPKGKYSIPVTSVSLPDRLIVSAVAFDPPVIRSTAPFEGRFTITDTRGYFIRGALVLVDVLPYGRIQKTKEQPTGDDGTVTITFTPTAKFRPSPGQSLVFFVRARKAGENLLAGISTRRLVLARVGAPGK